MHTIDEAQQEIITNFQILSDDREAMLIYLMELGQQLAPIKEEEKREENLIKGCQSKVWLTANEKDGKIFFNALSNTAIVQGLVSLLIKVFSGQTPEDIIQKDIWFINKIGMNRFIGTQRSNGFNAIIKSIKNYALMYKVKLNKNSLYI